MLGVVVGLVVVAALVTALLTARQSAELDPGSPEEAVQRYLDDVLDHDTEAAARALDPDGPCTVVDLDAAYVDDDVHVALRGVHLSGTTARVDVAITTGSGGLIPSPWSEEQTFRLRRSGEGWLITGAPWPLFECGMVR